jgi:5'-phosphate synthase pdxT subunit
MVKIGVLALQGAVAEHLRMIEMAGAEAVAVKRTEQLDELDGLILPGGESTTIGRLMKLYGFDQAIPQFAAKGKSLFGTCAGLILLAKDIHGGKPQSHLGVMDMTVLRNAFGRQKESFEAKLAIKHVADDVRGVFIRAPLIEKVGPEVEVLCVYEGQIVAARQGQYLATSFHPELTDDARLHHLFVQMTATRREESLC